MFPTSTNENKDLCSICKGGCCKSLPGCVDPSELGEVTVESIIDRFNKGFCFDYWEGNLPGKPDTITGYFMRPQIKGREGQIVHASWGGECKHLTESGCPFTYEDRPLGCRTLVPSPDFVCTDDGNYGKKQSAIAWLPYNSIIEEAIKIIEDQD